MSYWSERDFIVPCKEANSSVDFPEVFTLSEKDYWGDLTGVCVKVNIRGMLVEYFYQWCSFPKELRVEFWKQVNNTLLSPDDMRKVRFVAKQNKCFYKKPLTFCEKGTLEQYRRAIVQHRWLNEGHVY